LIRESSTELAHPLEHSLLHYLLDDRVLDLGAVLCAFIGRVHLREYRLREGRQI
jgi:hypothetical protein